MGIDRTAERDADFCVNLVPGSIFAMASPEVKSTCLPGGENVDVEEPRLQGPPPVCGGTAGAAGAVEAAMRPTVPDAPGRHGLWQVDGRKFQGKDTRLSHTFAVRPIRSSASGTGAAGAVEHEDGFVVMLHPKPLKRRRGKASFGAAQGRGFVHVKCCEPFDMELALLVEVGRGGPPAPGPPPARVLHNFARSQVCKLPGEWNFAEAVDPMTNTLWIGFDVVPADVTTPSPRSPECPAAAPQDPRAGHAAQAVDGDRHPEEEGGERHPEGHEAGTCVHDERHPEGREADTCVDDERHPEGREVGTRAPLDLGLDARAWPQPDSLADSIIVKNTFIDVVSLPPPLNVLRRCQTEPVASRHDLWFMEKHDDEPERQGEANLHGGPLQEDPLDAAVPVSLSLVQCVPPGDGAGLEDFGCAGSADQWADNAGLGLVAGADAAAIGMPVDAGFCIGCVPPWASLGPVVWLPGPEAEAAVGLDWSGCVAVGTLEALAGPMAPAAVMEGPQLHGLCAEGQGIPRGSRCWLYQAGPAPGLVPMPANGMHIEHPEPQAQPQPQRGELWEVDERKFRSKDTQCSHTFTVRGMQGLSFLVTLFPRPKKSCRGGSCFRAAGGRGFVRVKCSRQPDVDLALSVEMGPGGMAAPDMPSFRVHHNFARETICRLPGEWDFAAAVDPATSTVSVIFDVVPVSATTHPAGEHPA